MKTQEELETLVRKGIKQCSICLSESDIDEILNKTSKAQILEDYEIDNLRVCSECGKWMEEGYSVKDGEEFYCSDECLHKHYTEEEWNKMTEDVDSAECENFWTDWKDC